jgi:hypothetical protein
MVEVGYFVGEALLADFGVNVKGGNFYGRFNFKGKDLVGTYILKCKKLLDYLVLANFLYI